MDREKFDRKYKFVPAFDTKRGKRISLAPHLANDENYLNKHGFIIIEAPQKPNENGN